MALCVQLCVHSSTKLTKLTKLSPWLHWAQALLSSLLIILPVGSI